MSDNPMKKGRENPVLRKLNEGSEKVGLTTAFKNAKHRVGRVTNSIKSAFSQTSSVGTGVMQRIVGQLQAITKNPMIDILLGGGSILLMGYILKQTFYSLQRDSQNQFLSQAIYSWFVILSILYIASKIL